MSSEAEEIWRGRTDDQVVEAAACLDDYTEVGQRIILAELARRGLGLPTPLETPTPAPDDGAAALALLDELRQPRKRAWFKRVGLLVVTILLFTALGLLRWSPSEIAVLVVVLLVHETGHYAVMRGFGYRDVRMFFIPLLGAAVSGSGGSVAGYARVLVALAGPVPGILIGLVLAAFAPGHPMIGYTASLFLGLNLFNLLPLLPLDGGHVVRETLLVRSWWLETAFLVAAGTVMLLLAFWAGDVLLGLFGLSILLSVPGSLKVSGIVQRLKNAGGVPEVATVSEAPAEFLARVAEEVQQTFFAPKIALHPRCGGAKPAQLKGFVETVMEQLNRRPPRPLAAILLLAAYAWFFILAFIGLASLVGRA